MQLVYQVTASTIAERAQMVHTTAAAKISMSNVTCTSVLPAVVVMMHVAHMSFKMAHHAGTYCA